jgi:hypothetical protein
MKRILVLDGGGGKGVTTTSLLLLLEKRLGIKLCDFFDLIIGTSVGGIVGGCISTGILTAQEIHTMMLETMPKVFTNYHILWIPFLMAKYDTKELDEVLNTIIGSNFKMKNCVTKFICTAVNKIDSKTHYFKSWEEKDGELNLCNTMKRTYAAPFYFSSIKEDGNIWLDGGMGDARCPLIEGIIEGSRQKWFKNESVNILSIGTGCSYKNEKYLDATKLGQLGDILFYINPMEGGLARKQSIGIQVNLANSLENILDNFTFQRIDAQISKEMDKMDKMKFIKDYERIGIEMFNKIDINLLEKGR